MHPGTFENDDHSMNPMALTGKRILVTGASSGIGRETAILISRLGARVIMTARREDCLQEVISRLDGKGHGYHCSDLRDLEHIEYLVQRIAREGGPLDGFVHSAGMVGLNSTRPLTMTRYAFLQEVMAVNFYAFVELVRCITQRTHFQAGMSIVGVSSTASRQGNQGRIAYSASKAAMDAAVRCMAKELAPKKIRVNTVVPALIRTPITEVSLRNDLDSEDFRQDQARQYLGVGDSLDVANMIAFLLSHAAKFITGASIPIDGGRLSS